MKKFVKNTKVIHIGNEKKPRYFDPSVPDTDINTYGEGKGPWGSNALVKLQKVHVTIFDSVTEANDYDAYSEYYDENFQTLLDTSTTQELTGLIDFATTYRDQGTILEDSFVLPNTPTTQILEDMARAYDSNYDTLTVTEQNDLITKMTDVYNALNL